MSLHDITVVPWAKHSIQRPGCIWEGAAKSIIDEQIKREIEQKKIQENQRKQREKELMDEVNQGKKNKELDKRQKEIVDATNWAAKNKNNPEVKKALSEAQKNAPPGVKIVLEEIKDVREVADHQLLFVKKPTAGPGGPAPQSAKTLPTGGRLENNGPGLTSPDGKTTVKLQDGKLIRTQNGKEVDITDKLKKVDGAKGAVDHAVMDDKGNFTLRNKDGKPVYATNTGEKNNDGKPNAPYRTGASVSVDNDGVVRVTNSAGSPVWSHTEGHGAYKPAFTDKEIEALKTSLNAYGKNTPIIFEVDLENGTVKPAGDLKEGLDKAGVHKLDGVDKGRLTLNGPALEMYQRLNAEQKKQFGQLVYDMTHDASKAAPGLSEVISGESEDLGANFSKLSGEAQIEAVNQFASIEANTQLKPEQAAEKMDRLKAAIGAIADNPKAYDGPTQQEILKTAQDGKVDIKKFTAFVKDVGAGKYQDPKVRGELIKNYTKTKPENREAYVKFVTSDAFNKAPPKLQQALAPIAAENPDKAAKLADNKTYQKLVADGGFQKMSTEEQVSLSKKFMDDPAVEKTVKNILEDPDYTKSKDDGKKKDVWRSIDRYAGIDDGYKRTDDDKHDVDRREQILTERVWKENLKPKLLNGDQSYGDLWDRDAVWFDGDLQNLKDSLDGSNWSW